MAEAAEVTARLTGDAVWWARLQSFLTIGEITALVFTIGIGIAAVRAAFRANHITKDTARKELRAYVGLATNGFYPTGDGGYKIRITNFGNTPAKNAKIIRKIADGPPSVFDYADAWTLAESIAIQPGKDMIFVWAHFPADWTYRLVYGYIEYMDIYGDTWQSRFAWQHIRETEFIPYREHNDEIQIGSADQGSQTWPRQFWEWLKSFPV